jgi:hypothetical protein
VIHTFELHDRYDHVNKNPRSMYLSMHIKRSYSPRMRKECHSRFFVRTEKRHSYSWTRRFSKLPVSKKCLSFRNTHLFIYVYVSRHSTTATTQAYSRVSVLYRLRLLTTPIHAMCCFNCACSNSVQVMIVKFRNLI